MIKRIAAVIAISALSFASVPALAKDKAPTKRLPKVVHVCKSNDSSVDALACNLYMEARGENISGQMAIGFVTLNRMKNEAFPPSVRKVVYQASQFSWTKVTYNVRDADSWQVAKDVAKFLYKIRDNDILYNKLDPTNGSLYFHSRKSKPYWAKHLTKVVTIGDHVFYKPKEKGESNGR